MREAFDGDFFPELKSHYLSDDHRALIAGHADK